MKTLIILKGLSKIDKKNWICSEGLENFLLEYEIVKNLYSTPEILKSGVEVLSRSYTTLVHSRFIEILCSKLAKGCMVVLDMEQDSTGLVETLCEIFGYTVFYKVFPIPQDYLGKPKKYSPPQCQTKKRTDLEQDIKSFLNLQFDNKNKINNYVNVLEYWSKSNFEIWIGDDENILHVSDIHSNIDLVNKIPSDNKHNIKVYHGDYIDGPKKGGSREIIEKIIEGSDSEIWLEGNHDIRLRKYLGWKILNAAGKKILADQLYSELNSDFLTLTEPDFNDLDAESAKLMLKKLNKKLKTHITIHRGSQTFICTHAGLRDLSQLTPKYIGNVIYGNRNIDEYDCEFSKKYLAKNYWSIHAHCKYYSEWKVFKYSNVVNLDPKTDSEIVWAINSNKGFNNYQIEK